MKQTVEIEMDEERRIVLAGCCILEAVDSDRAWKLFWEAVQLARRELHQAQSRAHAEDDRAPASGSEQGDPVPRSTTRHRRRPARVVPLRLPLAAEPPADGGAHPGRNRLVDRILMTSFWVSEAESEGSSRG
jgi:hypothetical protein